MRSLSRPGIKSTDCHQLIRLALRPERANCHIFISTAMALARGRLEWQSQDLPSNLSLFSVASRERHQDLRAAEDDDLLRQIQNEHGLGLEQNDIAKIQKEYKPRGPRSIYELIDQLRNFRALIKVLLGEGLIFLHADRLVTWVEDSRDPIAHHHYEQNLYCRLAYAIDLRFYSLLERISRASDIHGCAFGATDFSDLERDIQNRAFRPPSLPPCLHEHRQQASTSGSSTSKKGGSNPTPSEPRNSRSRGNRPSQDGEKPPNKKKNRGAPVTNPSPSPDFRKLPGEEFYPVFVSAIREKEIPAARMADGRLFCLNWQITGRCYEECDRSHNHTVLPAGPDHQALLQWMQTARAKAATQK
jgi:hypothetical protein